MGAGGEPDAAARRSAGAVRDSSAASTASGAAAALRSPTLSTRRAPSARKRSRLDLVLREAQRRSAPSIGPIRPGQRCQRAIRARRQPAVEQQHRDAARMRRQTRFGHSSDSTQSARSGRQWSRKRSTAARQVDRHELVPRAPRGSRGLEQPRRGDRAGRDQHLEARAARRAGGRSAPASRSPRRRWRHASRPAARAGARRWRCPSRSREAARGLLCRACGAAPDRAIDQRRRAPRSAAR